MGLLMSKPWRQLTEAEVGRVGGWTGVYELGDANGSVLYVGVAGGKSLFGLKGELLRHLEAPGAATQFRIEVNAQYTTRWKELLMAHVASSGDLPPLNRTERLPSLGRLNL
jgi:hypothetical protein